MSENRNHYYSPEYMRPERLQAYIDQVRTIRSFTDPDDKILEIGIGNGYLSNVLKNYYCYSVTTLDVNQDLQPDLCADITASDFRLAEKYDIGLCFEVLEHLNWQDLSLAISNLTRHIRKFLLVSVPDTNFFVQSKLNVLWLKLTPLNLTLTIPRFLNNKQTIGKGHQWEIGIYQGDDRVTHRKLISDIFGSTNVVSDYRGREFPGHHFFIIKGQAK